MRHDKNKNVIKLVLDYIDQTQFRSIDLLKILSNSQQSIGILTLNWKSQSYFNVIKEIKAKWKPYNNLE